ncbi:hypothetical protein YYG_00060 [Plasmodium vinckei petteri]|uniref:WDHD1/CFT4 second beta-propeller domain-containing protein n=1 Tax=Plasmodium vinckei petteri TaxID=138298 RepID=W7ART8_PLAVN|nr:hypothetical protein YYG_00060 [Plasmodium vinckei petteri]CAD2112829.1 conserved Plasmodium protein, unknown function [Plasmodium vinckei petteri]
MEELFFADINSTNFLSSYNNKLLLISGNKIKFYKYVEIKNVVRAQNTEIYSIKDIDKNEQIVYVSNSVTVKRNYKGISTNDETVACNDKTSDDQNIESNSNAEQKHESGKKTKICYACIAFEQGNVWLCSEDESNKLFVYEKLIYRKICDIVKIELFVSNNNINALMLYKDYTLILYNEKMKNTIKIPIQQYVYNFCLSHNYQSLAIFNHADIYIYDLIKHVYSLNEQNELNNNAPLENGSNENTTSAQSTTNQKGYVEVKDIFNLSKNYKNILNCDWHPKNHCIALCGEKKVRYLTIYNYNVYDFSGPEVHQSFINTTKFVTIMDNITLLASLSCSDYLLCIWEFELEHCLYKFKSDYLISHFDMFYYNNYLHASLLAQKKHLANLKIMDSEILKKIESNDSDKESDIFQNNIEKSSNLGQDTQYQSNGYNKNQEEKQQSNNNGENLFDDNKKDYSESHSVDLRRKSNNYSNIEDEYINNSNKKKRKKKNVLDDDKSQDSFFNDHLHKKIAKNRRESTFEKNKREDNPVEYYENKNKIKNNSHKNEENAYNSDNSDKSDTHNKKLDNQSNISNTNEEAIYNSKKYNLQDFINKNKDVILNNKHDDTNMEDVNDLFNNEDEQENPAAFNSYVKYKFDQLRELKTQVDLLQKQVMGLTKINLYDFIVLSPGLCEEPENINDQWCMFWNDIGHITKKKEGNKTYIYIFLFRGEEVGKKKITDMYNVTSASLSAHGFALASNPYEKSQLKTNSILTFHNLKDNVIWNKYLPNDELIKGVANGNNFVAIVTSSNFLRIYSVYGYIINTILLKGIPVAISAYEHLLFIITCPYIFENVTSYNINNTYNCTLYKIHENFTNIKSNKYNTYHITILYEDILSLPSCHYLNWINMSNFGVPYIKDTSNYIYGLYPLFKKNNNIVYDWVPVFDMNNLNSPEPVKNSISLEQNQENNESKKDENPNNDDIAENDAEAINKCSYYPLYFDNYEQISVIKLNRNETEPRSNIIESCLGYNVEKKYVVMNECNLIKYDKFVKLLQTNPNLSLDNDSKNNESANLPWEQYDELRSRIDIYCKQLFANIYYDYTNDGKNKAANDTLKSFNKLYDKWVMRMFALLKNHTKNQKLAVKTSRLFKNIKNMMLSISLVDDEYSTLHSEITNEYLKRQIDDENYKKYEENLNYDDDYKDEDQKRKEIYEKYCNNHNLSENETKPNNGIKTTTKIYSNHNINNNIENKDKKDNRFLDKFFTGVTKNISVDNLFTQEKKNTQIKKKNTLENIFTELKEN